MARTPHSYSVKHKTPTKITQQAHCDKENMEPYQETRTEKGYHAKRMPLENISVTHKNHTKPSAMDTNPDIDHADLLQSMLDDLSKLTLQEIEPAVHYDRHDAGLINALLDKNVTATGDSGHTDAHTQECPF